MSKTLTVLPGPSSAEVDPVNALAPLDRTYGSDTALVSLEAPRSADGRFGPGNRADLEVAGTRPPKPLRRCWRARPKP